MKKSIIILALVAFAACKKDETNTPQPLGGNSCIDQMGNKVKCNCYDSNGQPAFCPQNP